MIVILTGVPQRRGMNEKIVMWVVKPFVKSSE
jgi:hypothetical protein